MGPATYVHLSKAHEALFLTEAELRRLHHRFCHPAVERLVQILREAGHDVDDAILQPITKFCHHCQVNSPAIHRFKFTLTDERNFNNEVIVDVMYL